MNMNTEVAPIQGFNKQEPIPGYFTKELIGVGGYGEVWKTHAPGGLLKAVKFVYGTLNSKRATRELRSLNRIKEVRHAFLLSIERIEIVDGNLVIVTELADQSLKQHFDKHRANGLRGLPRQELLEFLRDAADALDYIYENHSLQHLDIKPENLLLVGNRAKVADFGLIKNLYERSASLIEGLTPIYSPPELFEGKPNRNSDQYSLAIVYQEMLTGELPFDGMTAAHLAAQHLHTAPMLTALPKCDQPVIARALSKSPDGRFPSCRALIEALVEAGKENAESGKENTTPRDQRKVASSGAPLKTEPLDENSFDFARSQSVVCANSEDRAQLPSIELDDSVPTQHAPVLFVGIGGAATRTFRRLRARFRDRLGAMDALPAVDLLLLDTDVKSLNRATEGEIGAALHVSETLAMPLRRAEHYRSAAGKILGSISRRWVYNIPFSLQTEGFRPLGRLAMVDHSKRLMDRLRQSLTKITRDENIATTARSTGLDFSSHQPRVYIVASISGGTGGGMVLDLAYAVRSLLAELNLSDENVFGILMHSTPRGAGDRDKAIANSYATLSELWHYCRPGQNYPGDRACGLPPFHGNNRTFSNCYYLHLGDDLTEERLDAATDPVAEYLYSSAVTPAAGFFEKCRQMESARSGTESPEPLLRSFGLCQLGGSNSDIPAILAELLCRDLVCSWRSGPEKVVERATPRLSETMALIAAHDTTQQTRFFEIEERAAAKSAELDLSLEPMQAVAREILDQEVSSEVESYFVRLILDAFDAPQADADGKDLARVVAIVDAVLGDAASGEESNDDAKFDSLDTVLSTRLDSRAGKLAAEIRDWIFDLVDASEARAEGAKHAAEWFQNHLRTMERTAVTTAGQLREQIRMLKEAVLRDDVSRRAAGGNRPDAKWLREAQTRLFEYARLRLEHVIASSVARWLRLIEGQVTATLDRLQEFWADLNNLAASFNVTPSLGEAFDQSAAPEIVHSHWRSLLSNLIDHRAELVAALDRAMEEDLAVSCGTLRHFLTQSKDIPSRLATPLRAAARQMILRAMQDLSMSRLVERSDGTASVDSVEFHRCVEAARPLLQDGSAASRLLVMVPENIDPACILANLAQESSPPATVIRMTQGDLIACQEVEQLQVRCVAAGLVDNRRDYIEIANRLHARIDVNWDDMSTNGRSPV
jgi:eukaryotic-like serine/threonine-protein kinase